jgi:hypothetical protein
MAMVYACVVDTVGFSASATRIVNDDGPAAVGTPEIIPVLAATVRPVGREPADTEKVYGAKPPVAAIEVWYARPTIPPGVVAVVMATTPELTVSVNVFVALSCAAAPSGSINVSARNKLRSFIDFSLSLDLNYR